MKKILSAFIVLTALLSTSHSFAESISSSKIVRRCQSQNKHYGRMVYVDLLQTGENKYLAIFLEADDTSSPRTQFLVVDNIHRDEYTRGVMQSFYDDKGEKGKGFSMAPDTEDSNTYTQMTWITYRFNKQLLTGSFTCDHLNK